MLKVVRHWLAQESPGLSLMCIVSSSLNTSAENDCPTGGLALFFVHAAPIVLCE